MDNSQSNSIVKKIIKMRKKVPMPVWTILLFLIGLIVSITVYAYTTDNGVLKKDINNVEKRVSKLEECTATKNYVDNKMSDHEKIHKQEEKRYDDLKDHIDTRFDDVILLIKEKS
ncbi:hypothetical protein RPMD05_2 [Rhodobacteraceae phage LS06-2018-MD05]|nr:hypothetical protein RPMD05_2 [Rhodobacteraceae phage LS06-2018-MD05]